MWERGVINRKPHFTSDLPYVASFACMLPVLMTISVGKIFLVWRPCLHALSNVLPSSLSLALLLDFWQWDAAMSLPSWCLSFSLSNVCGHSSHFCLHWGSLWYFLLLLLLLWSFSFSRGQKKCLSSSSASHGTNLHVLGSHIFLCSWHLDGNVQKASVSLGKLPNSPYGVDRCQTCRRGSLLLEKQTCYLSSPQSITDLHTPSKSCQLLTFVISFVSVFVYKATKTLFGHFETLVNGSLQIYSIWMMNMGISHIVSI